MKLLNKLRSNNYRLLALFLLLLCCASLLGAFASEYLLGFKPCILCLYQRIPYFTVILLSSFALLASFFPSLFFLARKLLILCAILFVGNFILASYHVGIEHHIFTLTEGCMDKMASLAVNQEEMLGQLMKTEAVRCDKPTILFMNISMAELHSLYLMIWSMLIIFILKRPANNA